MLKREENIFLPHYELNGLTEYLVQIGFLDPQTAQEAFYQHPGQHDEAVIAFVNQLIDYAIRQSASDIHIEPAAEFCRIRLRRHGLLGKMADIPLSLAARIITRIKVLAKLDIAERRLPQDGHWKMHLDEPINIRVSTCPTCHGEKIVLRLLNTKHWTLDIHALGLSEQQEKILLEQITQPQGLILVTGPTGSGKTTTLYSILQHLNQIEKNISSLEDPVEIQLAGVNQIGINPKIGLTLDLSLRALLRQDPDVIMIGEIRDAETAQTAVQAAQTGHLVLSTLHTNSAVEALTRLKSMGIAPQQLGHALLLIIAQRLVRQICPLCQGNSCSACQQGYAGRLGIFELLSTSPTITSLLHAGADRDSILAQAKKEGFSSLWENALHHVAQGQTTLTEIKRVLKSD